LKIIIERQTDELNKALKFIGHSPNDVIEFKTFVREGIGLAVHAHLFEPLRGIRKGKGDTGGGEGKGKGRKYLLSTKELLRKHGHKQSNVPGKTWQQLYDTSDDGNFRYFKIRLPLIQLDQKETVKRTQ